MMTYRKAFLQYLFSGAVFSIISGGYATAQETPLFEELPSKKTGISFKNKITETHEHNALTYENLYNGGGVAVGDINNDGLEDLYFVSNMELNKLYLNLGDLKFKDITAPAGVKGHEGWKTAATMVDVNGDNLLDIYVCYSGKRDAEKRRNQLFINKGDLTFEEKAKEYGLDDPSYSTHAAFLDYDRDGDLDVFILATNVKVIRELEFERSRKEVHPYAGDKLFRNDNGRFTDVTLQAGILSNALGFGLGVAVADINQDGWPDIYVSNDYVEPDYLYINNGDGTFTDRLTDYLQHISHFSMGSDINDVNNDGLPDIMTMDMLPEDNRRQKLLYGPENYEQYALMVMKGFYHQSMRNMLHLNNGNDSFSEVGQLAGISNTDWSWAPLLADFDNDGWKDLFVTNGYFRDYTNRDFLKYKGDYYFQKAVAREKPDTLQLVSSMTSTPVHNYIFKNERGVTFSDKSLAWGFDKKGFSNGAVYADLDNDGDLDLVVNNQNDRASVYKCLARELTKNNYLAIRLKGRGKNTRAWNARIFVYTGREVQYFEQMPVRGYQSSVSDRIHVGLGAAAGADSIKVCWPGGQVSVLRQVPANQVLEISEASGQAVHAAPSEAATVFAGTPSLLNFRHIEYGSNDFKRQPLISTMPSVCGPIMAVGDVNGDGRSDVFAGGTKESPGKLFIQDHNGSFVESTGFFFKEDFLCTDADALFFDADNDGDNDLYIASGGYHDYAAKDPVLQDRLFLNDGKGNFKKAAGALPEIRTAKSCVRAADIDGDGDLDLFVGGRVIPGAYPLAPESSLLINNGHGRFVNATLSLAPALENPGMITDAVWVDVNDDTYPDLVVVGEFMPIRLFVNHKGEKLEDATAAYFQGHTEGLWNRIAVADFDHDGLADIVAGNFGLNSQFRASEEEPMRLVYSDFDKNGSIDPILTYYIQGRSYPFASRDEMLDQIYPLRKKFTTYESYADAQLTDIFSKSELEDAKELTACELNTVYFKNTGSGFVKQALPPEAQYAPVYAIQVLDYNHDGNMDFILAGNQNAIKIKLGIIDASYGQLFEGDGRGHFRYIPQTVSGLKITGDVKSLRMVQVAEEHYLFAGVNNVGVVCYKLNEP